ncbi:NfeD family protein [Urbifossiella limnaea]|uniref:NfeD-like C-terminal domain-containing protein n=1 Tax=Urbifossiella limnaea TaxID=2528023 RepID=A0A517Y2T2_9BACT|nr:NfeD family protein [Urbifossiella limnaea]QDU24055.1 hypothetical protein ETAA1_60660 [Urbifossiella limnaea]
MSARVVRVGDLGTALTAMSPSGVVELDGRRLDARSDGAPIPAGAAVVVLRGDPTGYVVRAVGPDQPIPQLPDAGAEIVRPEFMRNSAEVRRVEAADEAKLRRRWKVAARWRVVAGVFGGLIGGQILGDALAPPQVVLYRGHAEGGLGLAVGWAVGAALKLAGPLFRWSTLAGHAALASSLGGAAVGYWLAGDPHSFGQSAGAAAAGALVGVVAGWFVATRLELVFGGPEGPE